MKSSSSTVQKTTENLATTVKLISPHKPKYRSHYIFMSKTRYWFLSSSKIFFDIQNLRYFFKKVVHSVYTDPKYEIVTFFFVWLVALWFCMSFSGNTLYILMMKIITFSPLLGSQYSITVVLVQKKEKEKRNMLLSMEAA